MFITYEQLPTFPGGESELMKYLSSILKYPANAMYKNIEVSIRTPRMRYDQML